MRSLAKITAISAIGLSLALASAPASAAVLLSENFTSGFGAFTATGQAVISNGNAYVPCCGTTGSAANMANNFVSFGSGNQPSGLISAPIGLVTGTLYTLTFDYRALGGGAEPLFAIINGTTYSFSAVADNNLDNPYQSALVTFLAAGPSTTLQFQSAGIDNVDAIVDNVLLTGAVPEPGTWAMMLLGFGGIGMAMRRRRQPLAQVA